MEVENEEINALEVTNISLRIERYSGMQIYKYYGVVMQEAMLEQFLESPLVSPHFPPYYLTPMDAKI